MDALARMFHKAVDVSQSTARYPNRRRAAFPAKTDRRNGAGR